MALHIKKIKPLNNDIITTADRYQSDVKENGIIVANKGDLKLYQTVIAVGPVIRNIEVGDTVMLDLMQYAIMKYKPNELKGDMYTNEIVGWRLPLIDVYDEEDKSKEVLRLNERNIQFVFDGVEVNESIIIPDKPIIITN